MSLYTEKEIAERYERIGSRGRLKRRWFPLTWRQAGLALLLGFTVGWIVLIDTDVWPL